MKDLQLGFELMLTKVSEKTAVLEVSSRRMKDDSRELSNTLKELDVLNNLSKLVKDALSELNRLS